MDIVELFVELGANPVDSFEDPENSPLCQASKV